MSERRILVWDFPTRAFHWLLALTFFGAYVTGEAEGFRGLHLALGYTAAGLLGFRLLWGVVGTRYARFSGFVFSPRAALAYARSLLARTPQHFTGHNPLGSWAIVAMLLLLALVSASGIATDFAGKRFEELHEGIAAAALALALLHIAAVVASSMLHRENLARAMLTGYKRGRPEDAAGSARPVTAAALLAAVLAFWGGAFPSTWIKSSHGETASIGHQRGTGAADHDD